MDFEDNSTPIRNTIKCTNVPTKLLNKNEAKKYFKHFGRIAFISFRPKSKIITIEYSSPAEAEYALSQAGAYDGELFTVSYETKPKSTKKKRAIKDADPDWINDPDVRAELEAMSDDFSIKRKYNLRPEGMQVDADYSPPVEKKGRKSSKRIWKAETPKIIKPIVKERATPEQMELLNILKQPAMTIEDRYKALDARDKLLRLKRKAMQIDIAKISHTVGTCPDMCPEKERLMREVQHQVALYEQESTDRSMNHLLAVKQYSRSSADQESPLPHDLRNVDVLQMTMGYLTHKIMGLCDVTDVNMAEWYHFLWDRTRGIRKDITQQELCCQGSVELVEQCARFHIHCSARLVSEDPSVFDQKINTENLTKCLQTLKYMYHDLQIKGENCKNEAEFRAYVILLNLHDGNFMWEVQQLRPEIQTSKEIKFALDVYSALDKNNYVKFFKLVESTTYLNGCVLLRYFIQVRIRALETILKCYTPRAPHTLFPLQELIRILAFENSASAIDFLEYYGLNCNAGRTHIILDKRTFQLPDMPYTLDRAINIIETKRQGLVGEVICGRALPPPLFENHTIQNSFSEDGYLDISEFSNLISNQETVIGKSNVFKERSSSPMTVETKPINKSLEKPKLTDSIFGGNSQDSIGDTFKTNKINFGSSQSIFAKDDSIFAPAKDNIFASSNAGFSFPVQTIDQTDNAVKTGGFSFVLNERKLFEENLEIEMKKLEKQRTDEEERKKIEAEQKRIEEMIRKDFELIEAENERLKHEEDERLKAELMRKSRLIEEKKRFEEELKKKLDLELKLKQEETKRQQAKLLALQVKKKLRNEEIKRTVTSIMEEMLLAVEEDYKINRLKELKKRIINRKVITKWKRKVSNNKRKRKAIDQSPLWVSFKTTREAATELYTKTQDSTLSLMKRYKQGVPIHISPIMKMKIPKIELLNLTYNTLLKNFSKSTRPQNNYFWKINVITPGESESKSFNLIETTLDAYIDWKIGNGTKILLEQHSANLNKITYCLQNTKQSDNEANGFIYISDELNDDFVEKIQATLQNLGQNVFLPIALILRDDPSDIKSITEISEQGLISDFKIISGNFNGENLTSSLNVALQFLAENANPIPSLELNTLQSYLAQYLVSELWQRIISFSKWNIAYKKCLTLPKVAIGLYNEAIDRLKSIVLNKNTYEYGDFSVIFKDFLPSKIPDYLPCDYKYFPDFWKSSEYKRMVHETMDLLTMPKFYDSWPPVDQAELESCIYKYCDRIFESPDCAFYKVMGTILRNFDMDNMQGILWTNIIEIISREKLNDLDYNLNGLFGANTIFNQLFVVYETTKLQEYCSEAWFYLTNPIIKREIDMNLNKIEELPLVTYENNYEIDLDKTLTDLIEQEDFSERKKELKGFQSIQNMIDDLEESMALQKQISSRIQNSLQCILDDV